MGEKATGVRRNDKGVRIKEKDEEGRGTNKARRVAEKWDGNKRVRRAGPRD